MKLDSTHTMMKGMNESYEVSVAAAVVEHNLTKHETLEKKGDKRRKYIKETQKKRQPGEQQPETDAKATIESRPLTETRDKHTRKDNWEETQRQSLRKDRTTD